MTDIFSVKGFLIGTNCFLGNIMKPVQKTATCHPLKSGLIPRGSGCRSEHCPPVHVPVLLHVDHGPRLL